MLCKYKSVNRRKRRMQYEAYFSECKVPSCFCWNNVLPCVKFGPTVGVP